MSVTALEAPLRLRRSGSWRRLLRAYARRAHWVEPLTVLILLAAATTVATAANTWPRHLPWAALVPVAVVAGLFLSIRMLLLVDAYVLLAAAWVRAVAPQMPPLSGFLVVLLLVMAVMLYVARSRARLGLQGTHGETMLVDLRDRLRSQGELPELPEDWGAEIAVHAAYGGAFSGDFVVTSKSDDGRVLELVLVDVSGKGVAAGTRSLLLSGAFGGLLGAMPADRFLPSANAYLLRQRWQEGFATAVHVQVDLATGHYSVGSAGHPPAVRFLSGSGRWQVLEGAEGPALGVSELVAFPRVGGLLQRGDALLLYTDGVIETRTRDLTDGIDRMLGTAERMLRNGFAGMAERICAEARAGDTDDRAAVMVWRR
jgi:hypothetical protein